MFSTKCNISGELFKISLKHKLEVSENIKDTEIQNTLMLIYSSTSTKNITGIYTL